GIEFAYQQIDLDLQENSDTSRFAYNIEFEPVYALEDANKNGQKITRFLKTVDKTINSILKIKLSDTLVKKVRTYDYDMLWKAILERKPKDEKSVPGVFV